MKALFMKAIKPAPPKAAKPAPSADDRKAKITKDLAPLMAKPKGEPKDKGGEPTAEPGDGSAHFARLAA